MALQDIMFSMPFANSEASTITPEDLRELSEFEKSNPGQTRLVDDRATADNGPKSFMCFEGVPNVHRLYDFLLNHRYVQHTILQQNVSPVCGKIL
jgi:hypothetical protein